MVANCFCLRNKQKYLPKNTSLFGSVQGRFSLKISTSSSHPGEKEMERYERGRYGWGEMHGEQKDKVRIRLGKE